MLKSFLKLFALSMLMLATVISCGSDDDGGGGAPQVFYSMNSFGQCVRTSDQMPVAQQFCTNNGQCIDGNCFGTTICSGQYVWIAPNGEQFDVYCTPTNGNSGNCAGYGATNNHMLKCSSGHEVNGQCVNGQWDYHFCR